MQEVECATLNNSNLHHLARVYSELNYNLLGMEKEEKRLEFLGRAKSSGLKAQIFLKEQKPNRIVCPEYLNANCQTCEFEYLKL